MATGFDIERFVRAQGSGTYEQALAEIRAGRKRSHWIWFVFPQARGLGHSPMAERYGIGSREELDEYVNHPLLRARLLEISHALLALPGSDPVAALAGRNIVCGADLYLYFHGLNYQQNARDVQRFYQDPAGNLDVLEQYGVSYIYLSDYERAEQNADEAALDALFPKVYEAGRITIYAVGE